MNSPPTRRRDMLTFMLFGAMLTRFTLCKKGYAQDYGELDRALLTSRSIANIGTRLRPAEFPMSDSQAFFWQKLDFDGRLILAQASVNVASDVLGTYAFRSHFATWNAMEQANVPLLPRPMEVVIIPTEPEYRGSCPNLIDAVWETLLDSLDLLEEAKIISSVIKSIESDAEVKKNLDALDSAVQEPNIDRLVTGLYNLAALILQEQVLTIIIERLPDAIALKFLKSISTRLIPFVGPGYALIALGLAIHRNWRNLTCTPGSGPTSPPDLQLEPLDLPIDLQISNADVSSFFTPKS